MDAKQLSIFIENRQGRLEDVLNVLGENQINILSLSLADTSEYGLLRLMVNNPIKAKEALQNQGFSTILTDVLVIKIGHEVGMLHKIVYLLSEENINIEYMYGLSVKEIDATLVLKPSNIEKALIVLDKANVSVVTAEEIAKM